MNNLQTLTIKDIVTSDYRTAAIFEKYSLDFCCGGGTTVEQACKAKGLDPAVVFGDLRNAAGTAGSNGGVFSQMPLDELVDHIVTKHHAYVREAMPAILAHTQKVASVHGAYHPEVIAIAEHFVAVADEMQSHMMKEEHILFPYIKTLAHAQHTRTAIQPPPFGSVQHPIRMMEAEHQSAGDAMYKIRSLSSAYVPPAEACTTYRVSYLELQQFELDLHNHVHLENNILFPKAIELERELLH